MKRLLHISDDEKFLDRAIVHFEAAHPGGNDFVVWTRSENGELRFPPSGSLQPFPRIVCYSDDWMRPDFFDWDRYDAVVLHNLYSLPQIYFGENAPEGKVLCLMFFGAEFYNESSSYKGALHGEETKKLLAANSFRSCLNSLRDKVSGKKRQLRKRKEGVHAQQRKAFKRLDFFATHVFPEFELVTASLGILPKYLNYSYYTIEDFKVEDLLPERSVRRVMVGNSATASNNHMEVLLELKRVGYTGEILCPVSYGDKGYAARLVKAGKSLLGGQFRPIEEFMPLVEYNSMIGSCDAVILNSYRQQSFGNVMTALWLGTRVFLSRKSSLYKHFMSLGCHVHAIEDGLDADLLARASSLEELAQNRGALASAYRAKVFQDSLRTFIQSL